MIKISVDHAYAFDMLAILLVKSKKQNNIQNAQNYFAAASEIKDQIGVDKMQEVLNSQEFHDLRDINSEIFDLVTKAQTDECLASDIDKGNYQRYLAKKIVQERFFGGELKEQKIGY